MKSKFLISLILILIIFLINCSKKEHPEQKSEVLIKIDSVSSITFEPLSFNIKHKTIFKDSCIKYWIDSIIFNNYDILIHHFCNVNYYEDKEYINDDFNILEILKNESRIYISDSLAYNENIRNYKSYKKQSAANELEFGRKKVKTFDDLFDAWNNGNFEVFTFDTIKFYDKNESPKLIIWGDTKGMHCCSQLLIFELGEQFREIQYIASSHLDFDGENKELELKDIDNDNIPEITFYDPSWRYWNNSAGFEAPIINIILKYNNGNYHLYTERMLKNLPDEKSYNIMINKCRKLGNSVNNSSFLWSYMLDLIYTGHFDKAMEFLDKAWPPNVEGKDNYKKDFLNMLSQVQFGKELIEWK